MQIRNGFAVHILCLISTVCFVDCLEEFKVVWNVPSSACKDLDPAAYGLTANQNDSWQGDQVVIFYNRLGKYPYCRSHTTQCNGVNGGVPQAANLKAHLAQVEKDIDKAIPDRNFSGYAIIDWEAWRPVYDMNWDSRDIYRSYSRYLVRRSNPKLSEETIAKLAKERFEAGAKKFLVATLELCKKLRPHGKWGYWELPFCDYTAGYSHPYCSSDYDKYNQQLSYIMDISDVLYPPIYFSASEAGKNLQHAYARVKQAKDYRAKHKKPQKIVPYIKMEYDPTKSLNSFYSSPDLCSSIKYTYDVGVDSVIIWSSSNNMKQRCNALENYLDTTLGPFVENVLRDAQRCREDRCSNRGRCFTPDATPPKVCELAYVPTQLECACDEGFKGANCAQRAHNGTEISFLEIESSFKL